MRKILTCFFALALVAPAGHAADGAVSRVLPTGGDNTSSSVSRTNSSRVARRDASVSDANVRNSVSRVFSGATPSDISASRSGVVSRAVTHSDNGRGGLAAAVNTVGRNERVSSASINANPSVRRAGLVLRPSTAEVGGRATIGNTGVQTGSNIDEQLRTVKSRASVQATPESIALAKERLENTAALNKSCQEQYNECMDQFCAVIDANQKRCSCSANISKYAKVESAVKDANTQLNEVAQRIRYVGLSADEIRAIMTETEAEEALSGSTDTSETRNMLEEIEDLIRNPNVSTSYSGNSSGGFNLDIDLDFSGESADMFSLDFLNNDTASSFSNLRGAELYSAAKKRCNTVLTQCKEAGATSAQITGNYDLAIDKDCVAYEQGLTKMNETLVSNVRSANLMLQKARLAVLQNKNQYDAKGCIGALESCMTDDMVCGADYFKCVDPTKKYIDENGEVVLGQNISKITDFMTKYNNANINSKYLGDTYGGTTINETTCSVDKNDGSCVVKYLLTKIGTKAKVTDEGLCRAVLDKCQAYTYDKNGNYQPYNDVVTNYVQRAMVNIRAAQRNIISDYASSCMVDIANCYNQQVTQVNSWSTSASISSVYNVMRGACRNVALTCAYAVFDGEEKLCPTGDNANPATCINSISEMFYNSMLCSDGQVYENGKCVDKRNQIVFNFNNLAQGITDGTKIDKYLVQNEVFNLPDIRENLTNSGLESDEVSFTHYRSWCYMVSNTEMHCVPYGYDAACNNCTGGKCADGSAQKDKTCWAYTSDTSKYHTIQPYTNPQINIADVNKLVEKKAPTYVFLSLADNEKRCYSKTGTIFDEQGCRCRNGNAVGSKGTCVAVTEACPEGYEENKMSSEEDVTNISCYKTGITAKSIPPSGVTSN